MGRERVGIAVVGAGRMGRIRGVCAKRNTDCEVVEVVDSSPDRARALAAELGCAWSAEWQRTVERPDVDAIVVATPHKFLAPISVAALEAGKHVFCEKPGGLSFDDIAAVVGATGANPRLKVVVGFTLRHHPAISCAHQLVWQGSVGEPLYIRAHYGHGGRAGYHREWRGDRELAGGGELLDQGVHLLDLSRWFLGDFREVMSIVGTYFWGLPAGTSTALEDNAFVLLRAQGGEVASLHASWTQWKNAFSFEVYGREGFVQVTGLGGSYGNEHLLFGRRREDGGVPEMQEFDFRQVTEEHSAENPWRREWQDFLDVLLGRDSPGECRSATVSDALEALRIVECAYRASEERRTVLLSEAVACATAPHSNSAVLRYRS